MERLEQEIQIWESLTYKYYLKPWGWKRSPRDWMWAEKRSPSTKPWGSTILRNQGDEEESMKGLKMSSEWSRWITQGMWHPRRHVTSILRQRIDYEGPAVCLVKGCIHDPRSFFQQPSEAAVSPIFMWENGDSESLNNLPSKYMVELRVKQNWIGPTKLNFHSLTQCRYLGKRIVWKCLLKYS